MAVVVVVVLMVSARQMVEVACVVVVVVAMVLAGIPAQVAPDLAAKTLTLLAVEAQPAPTQSEVPGPLVIVRNAAKVAAADTA